MLKKRKQGKKVTPAGTRGYRDYDPRSINPLTEQFVPTEGSPIPRRAKQAGMT